MTSFDADGLKFTFPAAWTAGKYDDWSFYRSQFGCMWDGIKSVDLLAVDPQQTAWIVEVKDYRSNQRTKPSDLGEEVAHKVFDTLAALLPASLNANDQAEANVASAVLRAKRLRVVLHLEQPTKHSALRPRAIDPANVKSTLKRLLKPIDPHPFVAETNRMGALGWSVT